MSALCGLCFFRVLPVLAGACIGLFCLAGDLLFSVVLAAFFLLGFRALAAAFGEERLF